MSQFKVSALKYRPINFNEVVGQDMITKTLEKAIENNQLAQSLLFCGPVSYTHLTLPTSDLV